MPLWIEYLKVAISLLTLASIALAFLSYRANLKKVNEDRTRDRDKELLAQAQKSMQWAYEALTDEGKTIPPQANRLNWLTAARHLLRGRKLVDKIESDTYRTVIAEIEEFWRHKFHLALSHGELRNWTYFANTKDQAWPENIEISSALVIVDFSSWKAGETDPTDSVDRAHLMKEGGGLKGGYAGRGLEGYIFRIEEIKAVRFAPAHDDTHH